MIAPEEFEIKVNLPGFLKLLGSQFYSDPKACIRELIQNAHDSCIRRTVKSSFDNPEIRVALDRQRRTISFRDNGDGMTEEEIHKYLSTIGSGETGELRRALEQNNRLEAEKLIGQFGIGLLSAFAVGERVEVVTRSYLPGAPTLLWECSGDRFYTLREVASTDIGSTVTIFVQDKHYEVLQEDLVVKAIKQYADLLTIPIFLGSRGTAINAMNAPWQYDASEVEYEQFLARRYDASFLEVIPLRLEGEVKIYGALGIPETGIFAAAEYGDLDIYVRTMFVTGGDRQLLPPWAKFLRGVIDSPSLTPTVSRDSLIKDAAFRQVSDAVGEVIMAHLDYLAKRDPNRLQRIVTAHNTIIKKCAIENEAFFDRVADLVQFETEVGKLTIPRYLERLQGGTTIFYFKEAGSGTQQKILFSSIGVPVIDASFGVEEPFLRAYAAKNPRVTVQKMDEEAGIFQDVPPDPVWERLESDYLHALRIDARVKNFVPHDLPAVLVQKRQSSQKELAKLIALAGSVSDELKSILESLKGERDRSTQGMLTQDTILYVNANNPLIQLLGSLKFNSEVYLSALIVIYNNAVLLGQHAVSSDNALIMCRENNKAVELMVRQAMELESRRAAAGQ